ncbi:MAG: biopolymer transporter ExbD [bacterium]
MKLSRSSHVEEAHIDLTPMIDTVMFLLIFFMVSTRLGQTETDLGITLPGMMEASGPVDMPDEQIIEVDAKGTVVLNGTVYEGKEMLELVQTLGRYRVSSQASGNKYMITIQAEDGANYERVIDVMNACAGAGIKDVTFGSG